MCSVSADVASGAHRSFVRRRRATARVGSVTTLMYAAQQGDVRRVRRLIDGQPSPAALLARDRTGKTALHYCCVAENICAAQSADLLVMAAPDLVETRDEDGFTPLHLAVIAGNMQLVTFLLANDVDVNAVDNEKHTVVHWATVCGESEALRAVLAAGAPVSSPDVHGGYPLHYAAQMCGGGKGSELGLQVLQTLLTHKDIDVHVTDGDKRTPLLWAASAGSSKAILALVRAGALVESCDKDGLTALHCAASRGHTDCIDTLLTLCGASPDVIDSNGCTALHYAVTLGHADATALLLAHGTDPNRQDRKGRSPAHCGCAKGQFETVKLIAARGANLWLKNARGDYPLHEAAASGRRDLVKWLLEMRPSQVNASNNDGRTPLHMAALNDNADTCKILLDVGAEINTVLRTSKNVFMTPLDCALQRGFRSTAKYLQLHGGVPASRLTHQQVHVRKIQTNSALSLHIRDDVTFWDDSSSENEMETTEKRKKTHRRKHQKPNNEEKKKATSNLNSQKPENEELKLQGSSRIDYNNEIVINGKTEINIHHTEEVTVGEEKNQVPTRISSAEKEKRPRSAKYSKLRTKTSPTKQESEKSRVELRKSFSIRDQSNNTSEETAETVIETQVKSTMKSEEQPRHLPDQQSVLSTTSEDVEVQKDLIVEAAVHQPPKIEENQDRKGKKSEEEQLKNNEMKERSKKLQQEDKEVLDEILKELTVEETKNHEETETPKQEAVTLQTSNEEEKNNLVAESEEIVMSPKEVIVEDIQPNKVEKVKKEENEVGSKIVVDDIEKKNDKETTQNEENELGNKELTNMEKSEPRIEENDARKAKNDEKTPKKKEKPSPKNTDNSKSPPEDQRNKNKKSAYKIIETTNVEPIQTKNQQKIKKSKRKNLSSDEDTSKIEAASSVEENSYTSFSDSSTPPSPKRHASFTVLNDQEAENLSKIHKKHSKYEKKESSRFNDTKRSKIPTATHGRKEKPQSNLNIRVPSLPNLAEGKSHLKEPPRPDSIMSAPNLQSVFSENERSASDLEGETRRKKKRLKKRSRTRESKSAGSDYESSNLIDSGFEPSPRSSRIPKWKNISDRGVNMTSVTQTIQSNIRRYHLERKIFQQLLELKRAQIRAGQHNEAVLVKRAIDQYHRSCIATVGAGKYVPQDYTFKSFERFLYEALRKLQKNGPEYLKGLPAAPENPNPLLCTRSTNRCQHAIHAYTGVPCAAYLPKMDHHSIPKIGFDSVPCKPGTAGFLPAINPKKAVTLELSHGNDKQVIALPTDRLDQNKRYYVTFTVKGQENAPSGDEVCAKTAHRHSKSD